MPTQLRIRRWNRSFPSLLCSALLAIAPLARAQGAGDDPAGRALSRVELTRMADSLHALATRASLSDAQRDRLVIAEEAVRDRLARGDFLVGDRLVLSVVGQRELSDTFTVRSAQELLLPNLPPMPVGGVLRSEITAHVRDFVARYVRDPVVTVTPLVRLSVEGAVGRPGFYSVPSDEPLNEVIMRAGGPGAASNVSKTEIKRDGYLFWGKDLLAQRLYGGATVDALGLRSGDQIVVAEASHTNFTTLVQIAGGVVAILTAVYAISRH